MAAQSSCAHMLLPPLPAHMRMLLPPPPSALMLSTCAQTEESIREILRSARQAAPARGISADISLIDKAIDDYR